MRIAILTLPFFTNYGGILQGYALQTILERIGCRTQHLQPSFPFRSRPPWWVMPAVFMKRAFRKYVQKDGCLKVFEDPNKTISQHTRRFIREHLSIRYMKPKDWKDTLVDEYDGFIVGSDQVWRPKYCGHVDRMFFGFIRGRLTKRIAYAASFGTDENEYSENEVELCRKLMTDFTEISVRELSGINLCMDVFGRKAKCVLDPTLLLTAEDYRRLVPEDYSSQNRGKIMTYVLDKSREIASFVRKYSTYRNITAFSVMGNVDDASRPISERIQPPIEKWLCGFMDAQFVITDSFHGCVFSIIFHRPFFCLGNLNRGQDRFKSLLSIFGLEDRMVDPDTPLDALPKDMDWSKVDAILDFKRSEAVSFLLDAINS